VMARATPAPLSHLFPFLKGNLRLRRFPFLYLFPGKEASRHRRVFISLHFHRSEDRIFGYFLPLPQIIRIFPILFQ
jgi:hypothetical protein